MPRMRRLIRSALPAALAGALLVPAAPAAAGAARVVGQAVTVTTPDGVPLAGTWWGQPGRGPAVLLLHMLGRNRSDWDPLAEALAAAGMSVLTVDFRGHGESTRQGSRRLDYNDFNSHEWRMLTDDAEAAVAWMARRAEVDSARIGVVGASIGANSALVTASNDGRVRTLVLLSPGIDYHGLRTERAMERYGTRSILLVASADDEYSAGTVKRLGSLARGRYSVKVFQKAGHGTQMFSAEPTLAPLIRGWLTENLK